MLYTTCMHFTQVQVCSYVYIYSMYVCVHVLVSSILFFSVAPPIVLPRPLPPRCPGGKVFLRCGSACPLTCDSPEEIFECTANCVSGTGQLKYVFIYFLFKNTFHNSLHVCPAIPEYLQNIVCGLICSTGCFCPRGLVELGDKCVPPSECPSRLCRLPADPGPCEYV